MILVTLTLIPISNLKFLSLSQKIILIPDAIYFVILLPSWHLSLFLGTKRTSGGIVTSKVEKLIIYDKYDTVNVINDLALIKLPKELKLGTTEESLKAIELPEQGETVGDKCFMAGI